MTKFFGFPGFRLNGISAVAIVFAWFSPHAIADSNCYTVYAGCATCTYSAYDYTSGGYVSGYGQICQWTATTNPLPQSTYLWTPYGYQWCNAISALPPAGIVCATTPPPPPPTSPPASAPVIRVSGQTVSWSSVSGATSYNLLHASDGSVVVNVTTSPVTAPVLMCDIESFNVTACNAAGCSAPSNTVLVRGKQPTDGQSCP